MKKTVSRKLSSSYKSTPFQIGRAGAKKLPAAGKSVDRGSAKSYIDHLPMPKGKK